MKDQYCVMGNPVEHSKSPWIHQEFAQQTGQTLEYMQKKIPLDKFDQYLDDFRRQGGKGVNVTVPFKIQALEYVLKNAGAQNCTERAKLAGAVNTIKCHEDGGCFGDNTDGIGLVRDLINNLHWPIKNKQILLLGAGGAVRGVMAPLLAEQPKKIIIANRTLSKASELAKIFLNLGEVKAVGFEKLKEQQFDLIINGTSANLNNETLLLPTEIIKADTYCYDMTYSDDLTPFLKWARAQNSGYLSNGLGMLVEQAAEAFYLWRGVRPKTNTVLAKIKMCI